LEITGITWLEEIAEKLLTKHSVKQSEVEDVFANKPFIHFLEKGHRKGDNVYGALGRTDGGRYLTVVFVHKRNRRALVISARDMTQAERKRHDRK